MHFLQTTQQHGGWKKHQISGNFEQTIFFLVITSNKNIKHKTHVVPVTYTQEKKLAATASSEVLLMRFFFTQS